MATMELVHAIGLNGSAEQPLHVIQPESAGDNGTHDLVYASGGCVVLASLRDAHCQEFLRAHDAAITCLSVSGSGALACSGQHGDNPDAIVWDLQRRVQLFRLQEHDHGVASVGFSQDERFLYTMGVSQDSKLVVWDLQTGCIVSTQVLNKPAHCIAWGGRKKDIKGRDTTMLQLATAGSAYLKIWTLDPATGSLTSEDCVTGISRNYSCLAFSEDREYIFAGSTSGDFSALHVKNKVMHCVTAACSNAVASMLTLPPDARFPNEPYRIIVGGGDGSVTLYAGDGRHFRDLAAVQLEGAVSSVQLHGPNSFDLPLPLIAATSKGFIYQASLDAAHLSARRVVQQSHCGPVPAVAFAPGAAAAVATAGVDGTIALWDLSSYNVMTHGSCQVSKTGAPLAISFSGEVIFTGWADGKLRAHDAEDGALLWTIDDAHRNGATALQTAHNSKFIVSGGDNGEVRAWEIRTRDMIRHLKQHTMTVTSLQISPDDSKVVSASRDRSILVWDLAQGTRLSALYQQMGGINSVALFMDENGEATQLVSVGQDKKMSFWHTSDRSPIESIGDGIGEQHAIAANSTGTLFATAGADAKVRLWQYNPTALLLEGVGHSAAVLSLAFSPDDKQLVSVGDDGNVLVWNIYQ